MKANAVTSVTEKTGVAMIAVSADDAGMRLDRFLKRHLPGLPMGLIHKLLRTGQVRLDGARVKGDRRLDVGNLVRIPPVRPTVLPLGGISETPPAAMVKALEGSVLLQGDGFMVINKPSGWPVHGGSGQAVGLIDGLRYLWPLSQGKLELCHRLDRDTSGCLLLATQRQTASTLTAAFRDGLMHKTYLALVKGCPSPPQGRINVPLTKGIIRSGERMVIADHSGQAARTHYRLLERLGRASLLEVTLETGRTHQVRAHLQALGHPVVGDDKYGDREFNRVMKKMGMKRLFLHARALTFPHPKTGVPVMVTAPMDSSLTGVIDQCREKLSNRLKDNSF
ncbi:MAG: RluA family pseudouridine synthase [Magnetococcales bacterium]|nr:RluA family pseudouridine synthase [Magnetococcales bacterium]